METDCSLELTLEAREDLKDIWRYISEDSASAADRFIDKLYSECIRIFESEHHGRNRPDVGEGITSYETVQLAVFRSGWDPLL